MERTTRVGLARKMPSVRSSEFLSTRVTVGLELARPQTPGDMVYGTKMLMHATNL